MFVSCWFWLIIVCVGFSFGFVVWRLIAFCCLLLALPVVCVSIAYSADGCVAALRVKLD